MATEHWSEEYKRMLEDCIKRSDRLSGWEENFCQSMSEWFEAGKLPTPRQCETLDRIWEKVTR